MYLKLRKNWYFLFQAFCIALYFVFALWNASLGQVQPLFQEIHISSNEQLASLQIV